MKNINEITTNTKILLILIVAIAFVYGLSFYKRQANYQYWMENPQKFVVENVVAMSTMDAFYWVRMAKELDKGNIGKGLKDQKRAYPDLAPFAISDTASLLAYLISFGKNFTGDNYYKSGLLLIPILSGFFIFPLFYYFHRIGFGVSAVLGGLIGSFSNAYYARTRMGRLDTDLLNTFFPLLAACFILPVSRQKSLRTNLFLAFGAGFTLFLFTWWYQQPSFILVYFIVFALYLLLNRIPWKQSLGILVVFLIASGPQNLWTIADSVRIFLLAYVSPAPTGQISWPNVFDTVAEIKNRGLFAKLEMLHGFLPLVFLGFAGLVYLYGRHFKKMIPITPLIMLGLWSLVGPTRFNMYLAPFIGIGVGVLVELSMHLAQKKFDFRPLLTVLGSLAIVLTLFFSSAAHTGFPYYSQGTISAGTIRALLDVKKQVPEGAVMYTPYWEYGYPLMDIGEFATYHDGGVQGGIRSTLTAKAMTSTRQQDMVSLLSYLEDYGFRHLSAKILQDKLSPQQMMSLVFDYSDDFTADNVYVLYLEEMIGKFGSMAHFGEWDFEKRKSKKLDYFEIHCFSMNNNIITCHDGIVDLNRGVMNDGSNDVPLKSVIWVSNGYVSERIDYEKKDGYYLQILIRNGSIYRFLVADEDLYQTNFNQQFLLGNFNRKYFEEIHNEFPVARILKVKDSDRGQSAQ